MQAADTEKSDPEDMKPINQIVTGKNVEGTAACYIAEEQGILHVDDRCDWVGSFTSRSDHVVSCQFRRLVVCPLVSELCLVECKGHGYTRGELRTHLSQFGKASKLICRNFGKISKELELFKEGHYQLSNFSMFKDRQKQCNDDICIGIYSGQTQQGEGGKFIKEGSGVFKGNEGFTSYVGEYKNNMKHGHGKFSHSLFHYIGMFSEDKMQGDCLYFCNSHTGRCGSGIFENNVMHGMGKIWSNSRTSKFKYVGQFLNDKRHGLGTQVNAAGTRSFTGEFRNDAISGVGVCTLLATKHTISGSFTGEHCFGQGVQKDQFGVVVYVGNFVRSIKDGKGVMTYANGDVYTGSFSQGLKQGQGVLTFANKSEYRGEFFADKFHGDGVMVESNGVLGETLRYFKGEVVPVTHL